MPAVFVVINSSHFIQYFAHFVHLSIARLVFQKYLVSINKAKMKKFFPASVFIFMLAFATAIVIHRSASSSGEQANPLYKDSTALPYECNFTHGAGYAVLLNY